MTAYLIRFADGSYSLDFETDFLIEERRNFEKFGVQVVKMDSEELDKFFYSHELLDVMEENFND